MAIAVTNQGLEKINRGNLICTTLATSAAGPTTLQAADADYCLDIVSITFVNNVASAQAITLTDGAATAFIVNLPPTGGGTVVLNFNGAVWKQTAKNQAWTITQTATATTTIAVFRKAAP